jgi:hypothetical protein
MHVGGRGGRGPNIQAESECLLRHVRTGDRDVLVAGDLFRPIDRRLDSVDERRRRPFFGGIRRRAMSDHDDGCAGRVLVVPTVGDVEQAPADDETMTSGYAVDCY